MAAYAGTTAALMRSIERAFASETDYPNATMLEWCEEHGDKEIDARLASAGFTTPITGTVPDLIKDISARLGVAHGLQSAMTSHTTRPVEVAAVHREIALQQLEAIASGQMDIGLTRSASGRPVVYTSDPETLHANATIVGDETTWRMPAETRE